jgi:hypothetical protein
VKPQSTVPPRRPPRTPHGTMGVFRHVDDAGAAIRALHEAGLRDLSVFSPVPYHELEHAQRQRASPVRWVALAGGVSGISGGFALCVWSVRHWPLVTGGKELVSLPPFVVIGYESMILLAGILNLIGMLLLAGLPQRRAPAPYDPRFSEDRIGVWVPGGGETLERARRALEANGADEVTVHA